MNNKRKKKRKRPEKKQKKMKVLTNINYVINEFTPFSFLLHNPLPQFMEQFQQISFLHLHACVHIFCTLFTLLSPFPATSLLPLVPTFPLGRTCSALLFSDFVEEN
jgi:hypothetical protein